jgi:hypothetical protein
LELFSQFTHQRPVANVKKQGLKPRLVRAGYLGDQAKDLLMPALEKNAPLRVRIVALEAAHLSADGVDSVSISVWGNPADIVLPVYRASIYSKSRISDSSL